MRSSYKIHNKSELYFITSTIIEWIPVFTSEAYFNILTETIRFSQNKKNLKVYAYVILDNHFHAIVQNEDLTNIMKSIKSYTAKHILEQIKTDEKEWLINQLYYYKLNHKIQSDFQVWQESFHPQQILTDSMFEQKINYIHNNPVKRGFVTKPEHWLYSSALFYLTGEEGVIKIDKFDYLNQAGA